MVLVTPENLKVSYDMTTLKNKAVFALGMKSVCVTDFTRDDIPSKNYYSIGLYYHPNPKTPDGLPWVSHDGLINPESDFGPKRELRKIIQSVFTLAVSGYFIDNKYSLHAVNLLKNWFLDKNNGMNPNLENAQMVPGVNLGRRVGVIDSHIWINIIVALDFLEKTVDDKQFFSDMRNWFARYADWLMLSLRGKDALGIGNNISSWCIAQILAFSIFSKQRSNYIDLCKQFFKKFISEQMDKNGCFTKEISRTRSLHYSLFNLQALTIAAEILYQHDENLYNWHDANGQCLQKSFDFLVPFLLKEKTWPYPQILDEKISKQFCFHIAALRYNDNTYKNTNNVFTKDPDFCDIMGPEYVWINKSKNDRVR